VWPRHFNEENAQEYHRQPEKIANRAYRDRMGNGDEESGDGWRYRGRGAIQLTGYNNYNAFSEDAGMDIEDAVDYLETLEGAVESAAWFWLKNDLNEMADDRDNTAMTKRINGGTHGIEDRKERLINNLEILLGD
jgi:putative chitinase